MISGSGLLIKWYAIVILYWLSIGSMLVAAPMIDVAQKELKWSQHCLKLEKIQKVYLYQYTKMVKARYLLSKSFPFVSKNIFGGMEMVTKYTMEKDK